MTDIESIITYFGKGHDYIKVSPYVCLNNEDADGVMIRFYDREGGLIDCVVSSNPGMIVETAEVRPRMPHY